MQADNASPQELIMVQLVTDQSFFAKLAHHCAESRGFISLKKGRLESKFTKEEDARLSRIMS